MDKELLYEHQAGIEKYFEDYGYNVLNLKMCTVEIRKNADIDGLPDFTVSIRDDDKRYHLYKEYKNDSRSKRESIVFECDIECKVGGKNGKKLDAVRCNFYESQLQDDKMKYYSIINRSNEHWIIHANIKRLVDKKLSAGKKVWEDKSRQTKQGLHKELRDPSSADFPFKIVAKLK